MRKTKIICTLGPSTDSPEILQAMMENGMDVARFNFSHGSHDEHKRRLEELKALRKKLNLPVAALLDTKGPEIRLRTFEEGKVTLEAGQHFTLTAREVIGTQEICSVSYKNLAQKEGQQQHQQNFHQQKHCGGRRPAVRPKDPPKGTQWLHRPSPPHPTPGSTSR